MTAYIGVFSFGVPFSLSHHHNVKSKETRYEDLVKIK